MNQNTTNNHQNKEMESEFPYSNYKPQQQDLGSFVQRFFRILLIHKWLFISILAFVVLLVLFFGMRQPKQYMSNYEVFYNETMREYLNTDNAPVIKSDFDKNYWLSAMRSNEVMKATIKNSGLPYSVTQLRGMMVVNIFDKRKEDRIPVYIVSIASSSRDHIPILIRAYVKSLNELLLQNQLTNSERLIVYLSDQIAQNNQKLNQIDLRILQTGSSNGTEIIDFNKISMTLDGFRADLLNSRVNLASIVSARSRTESELKNLDGTIVNESAFSEPLKVQLMNLEVDLARSLTRNKENHPEVKQIRRNIEHISTMIRDTLQQRMEVRSLIQNPVKSQLIAKLMDYRIQEVSEETKIKSIERIISELEQKMLPGAVNEEQQQTLRNREMISLTLKQLNDKLIETQSTSQGSLSRFVFVDDPSSVYAANKGLLYHLLLALTLALIIAAVVVFFYDMLDDRIMLPEDFERFFGTKVLGVVRHYNSNDNATLADKSLAPNYYRTSNELSTLIINLRQVQKLRNFNTFALLSPDRLEGKSLVSMKLGAALALKMQRVLLVDMDFFSPKLSSVIDPECEKGLSNYLLDELKLDEIIRKTDIETLEFVNAGNAGGQKELFYNNAKLTEFIAWAKEKYDIVLFDTPAANYIPDIAELFENVDGLLLVVRLRRTTRTLVSRMFNTFSVFDNKFKAAILNDFMPENSMNNSEYDYKYNDSSVSLSKKLVDKIKRPQKSILFMIIISVITVIVIAITGYRNYRITQNAMQAPDTLLIDTAAVNTNSMLFVPDSISSNQTNYQQADSMIIVDETSYEDIAVARYANPTFWVYIYLVNQHRKIDPTNLKEGDVVYLPSEDNYNLNATDEQAVLKAQKIEKAILSGNL